MKTKINKKGFTLIELLVVVAIIGILAAIVLVSLNSARERAQEAALQSTLASITTLAALCVNDNGAVNAPTSATAGGGDLCAPTTITAEVWPALQGVGAPQGLENAGCSYLVTSDDTISAACDADGVAPVDWTVTCSVANGNCDRS